MPKIHSSYNLMCMVAIVFATSAGCRSVEEPQTLGPFDGAWLDLSYDFSSETVYWPTSAPFELDTVSFGKTPGGWFYSAFAFSGAEHGGTHLDAPIHFSEGKYTVDQVPIESFVGPAAVVDVSESAAGNRDYLVMRSDIENWERVYGGLPEGSMVLIRTGFGRFWPDPVAYMGTDEKGPDAVKDLHFPGLDSDAAEFLTSERSIKGIGIDTPSIDYGQSTSFEAHQILASDNVLVFENVANLDEMPADGAFLLAAPMKIKGGSGGPLRLFGFVPAGT